MQIVIYNHQPGGPNLFDSRLFFWCFRIYAPWRQGGPGKSSTFFRLLDTHVLVWGYSDSQPRFGRSLNPKGYIFIIVTETLDATNRLRLEQTSISEADYVSVFRRKGQMCEPTFCAL
jgi:hypothetical protein